jgi:hypothetical protein
MTHPQNPISEPETVSGPGAGSARKARRLAVVGAAALLVAAGGATAAYATSNGGSESGYATVITSTEGTPSETGTPVEVAPPAGPEGDQPSSWQDCPEKQGGTGDHGGPATPESEAASPAPDSSTL